MAVLGLLFNSTPFSALENVRFEGHEVSIRQGSGKEKNPTGRDFFDIGGWRKGEL